MKRIGIVAHSALLCLGVFSTETTARFVAVIEGLKARGAECVILGCTEILLIVTPQNSPLPVLDSTRLLGQRAVDAPLRPELEARDGWVRM